MNKITVEMDLPNSTLTEVIPGVTIHNTTGEQLHLKVELGPCKIEPPSMEAVTKMDSAPAEHVSVRGTGSPSGPEKQAE